MGTQVLFFVCVGVCVCVCARACIGFGGRRPVFGFDVIF